MSALKTLKLSNIAPPATAGSPKERARNKVIAHLEQQKALLAAHVEGKPFDVVRPVYKTNEAGERVRVSKPVFVKRGWFDDGTGTLFFSVRYGSKPLRLDKAGSTSVEVGKDLGALPEVLDTLLSAVRAGELDVALVAASAERGKAFKRRNVTPQAA